MTHSELQTKKASEKPAYQDALSNQDSIGSYVIIKDIFDIFGKLTKNEGNEIKLVDAINFQAQREPFKVLEGTRFDCSAIEGFTPAVNHEYKKKGNK